MLNEKRLQAAESWSAEEKDKARGQNFVVLGGFNRILYARFTLKRYIIERNKHFIFKDTYPYVLKSGAKVIDPGADNGDAEYKDDFVGPSTGKTYTYHAGRGYNNAGGYVYIFNPSLSTEPEIAQALSELYYDGWFDLQT